MKGLRLHIESPDERRLIAFHFKALGIVYYPPLDAWVLQKDLDSLGEKTHYTMSSVDLGVAQR